MPALKTVEVVLYPIFHVALGQCYAHLLALVFRLVELLGGVVRGSLRARRLFLSAASLGVLFLRDPTYVGHGRGRHTLALKDVGAPERLYALEALRLAFRDVCVLPLGEVLQELAIFGHQRRARLLVAHLLVAFDLLLQRHDPEDEGLRARWTPWYVDVHGDDPVSPHENRVTVEERTTRDDPLGLRHLLVETRHPLGHLGGDCARGDHKVSLPGRSGEETGSEPVEVVVGHARGHHLDRATGQAELQGPE